MLPADKPRYLMGVGFPRDIVAAVAAGVDMFDCVMPTRNGRNAYAFTAGGRDPAAEQPVHARRRARSRTAATATPAGTFTRGAIRHFFFAGEMLGPILVSVHNIRFYQRLMADVRRAIGAGTFDEFRRTDPRCGLGPREQESEVRDQESDGCGDAVAV